MLFWLEVDTSHTSRKKMKKIYTQRIRFAGTHAYTWAIPIVFCIMSPKWVVPGICDLRLDIPSRLPMFSKSVAELAWMPPWSVCEIISDNRDRTLPC